MQTTQEMELCRLIMNDDSFGVTPNVEEWKQWDREDYYLARDLFFDGDPALVESFLTGIPMVNLKDFYRFVEVLVRLVNYPIRNPELRPQKHDLICYVEDHKLLRNFFLFFDWYFTEMYKEHAKFVEVFARYWHTVHIPL